MSTEAKPIFEAKPIPAAKPIAFDQVQANILLPYTRANCGRLLCVRFDAARPGTAAALSPARAWLDAMQKLVTFHEDVRDVRGQSIEQGAGPWFNIGITHEGLLALGYDPFTRKYMPEAFLEGMEQRRSRLGDGTKERAAADAQVHAIVLCYAFDPTVELHARKVGVAAHEWLPLEVDEIKDLEYAVGGALDALLQNLLPKIAGVEYVHALDHDMYRLSAGEVVGLEYFGFRDGVAQPRIFGVPSDHPSVMDTVPGSVLLGHSAPALPVSDGTAIEAETREQLALDHLAHGSFLVVRHLVQDIEAFRAEAASKAEALGTGLLATRLAEYMMGRRRDGHPLSALGGASLDDFTYDDDRDGQRCPFHAHARRVNPRDERSPARRLMRRGMPTSGYRYKRDERGLLFMAYNADIEGQFEFVQRQWVNAGAESHGLSTDRDPIAGDVAVLRGVAQDSGTFSFVSTETNTHHAVTGLQSFVQARWGAYALMPSRATLAELAADPKSPIAEYKARVTGLDLVLRRDILGRWLDDPDMCRRIFAEVRELGGVVRLDDEQVVLVGSAELVAEVAHDDGKLYSVARQGEAMRQTTGAFYLGMDAWTSDYKNDSQASCVLIPGWKQETQLWSANGAARDAIKAEQTAELQKVREAVALLCKVFISLSMTKAIADHQTPGTPLRGEFALAEFTAFVLAGLSPTIFGVPQPSARATIGLNIPPSGYTFFAFPDAAYIELADQASKGICTYLERLFSDRARRRAGTVFPPHQHHVSGKAPACPYVAPGQDPDLKWQATLDTTLQRLEQMFHDQGRECTLEDRVRLMGGVISGMLITSFKVFSDGVSEYVRTIPIDTAIRVDPAGAARLPFAVMKQHERSMPNIIYRRVMQPVRLGALTLSVDDVVLASQGSAMVGRDGALSEDDWFYGDRTPRDAERPESPHFCPGYRVADAIIETMSVALFLMLPDLRRKSADGEPLELTYDWAELNKRVTQTPH